MSDRTSNISIRGEEHRPVRLSAVATFHGVLVCIDDAGDGQPMANLRLTEEDARRLVGRVGQALAAKVIH